MNAILQSRFVETFGWTLVHSLWQLALVGAAWWAVLGMLKGARAEVRYVVAAVGLVVMMGLPVGTYVWMLPAAGRAGVEVTRSVGGAVEGGTVVRVGVMAVGTAGATWGERVREAVTPWLPVAVAGYGMGAAVVLARLLAGYWRLRGMVGRARALEGAMAERFAEVSRKVGVKRAVRLLESAAVEVPTLIGAVRPAILLPAAALTGLTVGQLEALLAHELAHVRRHDYVCNLVQSVIDALLFYHPAVWWLSGRVRQERELCCDNVAAGVAASRVEYARALVAMEGLRGLPVGALGAAGGAGGSLKGRIAGILGAGKDQRPGRMVSAASVGLVVMMVAAVVYVGCREGTEVAAATGSAPASREVSSDKKEALGSEGALADGVTGETTAATGTVTGNATGGGSEPVKILKEGDLSLEEGEYLIQAKVVDIDVEYVKELTGGTAQGDGLNSVLSTAEINRRLEALEKARHAVVVSRPMVKTAEGVSARIFVGQQVPTKDFDKEAGKDRELPIKYVDVGTQMGVRATAAAADPSGQTVELEMHLSMSDVSWHPATTETGYLQTLVDNRKMETTIKVKQGETVLLALSKAPGEKAEDKTPGKERLCLVTAKTGSKK
jgi:beta-lactamase regulating signal transducer with metallopeptidase domain